MDNLFFFKSVLNDFGYYKSVLGLSNFAKTKRTFTKMKLSPHAAVCEESRSALFEISRKPLPIPAMLLMYDTTCPKPQPF